MLKILNSGRRLEGLPARGLLAHEQSPEEVRAALAAWEDALQGLKEPRAALDAAEAQAREEVLLVPGERNRWDAETRDRTTTQAEAMRAAERALRAAASALEAALTEHADAVGVLGARLALEEHARALDAALDAAEARARFSAYGGSRYGLRPDLDPRIVTRQRAGAVQESTLDVLDRVDAHAVAERAGTRLDLVEVVSRRTGARMLTTERRAASLVGRGRSEWLHVDKTKEGAA
ncbi:MAG: hypothetical protein CMH83_02525 [Nocardioides sp.]|nr:hypothetical protein [Nocardioides sp.]